MPRIGKTRTNIGFLKKRVFSQKLLSCRAVGEHSQYMLNRNASITDSWFSRKSLAVGLNTDC